MLFGTLGANLLSNRLAGKGTISTGKGSIATSQGRGIITANQDL